MSIVLDEKRAKLFKVMSDVARMEADPTHRFPGLEEGIKEGLLLLSEAEVALFCEFPVEVLRQAAIDSFPPEARMAKPN